MHLVYATYQYFPDSRTNTFQSISTIKEYLNLGYEVDLVYPDRKNLKQNENINDFYNIDKEFNKIKIGHLSKNTYSKENLYNKLIYLANHFFYAYKLKNIVLKLTKDDTCIFTRSPFIVYFLRTLNKPIIYEIHQLTKISKFLIKIFMKGSRNILLIAVSPGISKTLNRLEINSDYVEYLETGYDEELFSKIEKTNKGIHKLENRVQFIFGGSSKIQGTEKGIKRLIQCFDEVCNENKLDNIYFDIYCSNDLEKLDLDKFLNTNNFSSQIIVHNRITNYDFIKKLLQSHIGFIPLPNTDHVNNFSSSMKFFEYIRANLFIIGSDVEANKRFDYEKLKLYKENNESIKKSIVFAIENHNMENNLLNEKIINFSYSNRIKIINDRLKSLN